ncbi:hypothetical protein R69746_08055 [Paraburkholderia aspalathi]|uniref:molybdopterin-dependent oxidoreductase n=1 Tax=Paraburkholderia aspalathi TaxID=1324617 RepID=UPI00190A58AD|nr:molybdopterin-dependent oxidoreductase [Paraburkholderia aspalathi]MBK3844018.1 molybdopterin-dependent oxidoreductase [Paraburkholderia aspalathi]CAE6865304.1 hypothetical protein R69746_08055 [Paraburkholderia aspalathi]CAE6867222.1 hypothetical protein R75465_08042 [Paraburkholderia aspalathi]
MRHKKSVHWLVFAALFASFAAGAAPLQLQVSGKISTYTNAATHEYDLNEEQILAMKQASIRTSTNWTQSMNFTGFLVTDLLKKIGATGSQLEIHCLDGYVYTVPIYEMQKFGVILAYERDGKRMAVKDYGPLGLIYPRDQHPSELSGPATDAKFMWQVSRMIVK